MKTINRLIALVILVVMLINLFGCYGSFALTKKVHEWNGSLGDKWLNTVVMWILLFVPVYNATTFIDFVVLNTVEFWTGSNPLAMQDGQQNVQYASNDGKTYKITMTKNNMNIIQTIGPDKGQAINITYHPETGNWTLNDGNGDKVIANMSSNNLKLLYPNGEFKEIKNAY